MGADDLRGPQACRLRRAGPWVGAALLAVAAAVGWQYAQAFSAESNQWQQYARWFQGGFLYVPGALIALGAGLLVSGWPESSRSLPGAQRFAGAEWRQLTSRRRIIVSIARVLILAAGLFVCGAMSLGVLRGWPRSYHRTHYFMEVLAVFSIFVSFGFSGMVPLIAGIGAASSLAASRRSGAARDLLLAPEAADHLGWAVARGRARRGLVLLAAGLPYHYVSVFLLTLEWHSHLDGYVLPAVILLVLVALIEAAMIWRSAALGAWLGSAVNSPAAAGALAAGGVIIMWGLRLAAFGLGLAMAFEGFRRRSPERFWMWVLVVCGWEFVFFALVTPLLLWLTRGSLRAPLSMRLGQWMIRTGGRISGLDGGDGRVTVVPRGSGGAGCPANGSGSWKAWTVALWVLAVMLFLAFPLAGITAHEMALEPGVAGFFFALYATVAVGLIAAVWLVARLVRRRFVAAARTGAGR